jgi:hypothetical protein
MPTSAKLESLPPELRELADQAMRAKFPELIEPELVEDNEWQEAVKRQGYPWQANYQSAQQQARMYNTPNFGSGRERRWTVNFRPIEGVGPDPRRPVDPDRLDHLYRRMRQNNRVDVAHYIVRNDHERPYYMERIKLKTAQLEDYYGIPFTWEICP